MKNSKLYPNCISGNLSTFIFDENSLVDINEIEDLTGTVSELNQDTVDRDDLNGNNYFFGPGLIDLQVNGINGIDFNSAAVTIKQVRDAVYYLLTQGVTTFFPTLITNTKLNISTILATIAEACASDELVNQCIRGIHLEGPFLSPVPGARGAHDEKLLTLPDWPLFQRWQQSAGGRIKMVTIAPELDGALTFIENCRAQGVMVSIGHSMADTEQVHNAVKSGATIATHLGNAVPLILPRHPNILWDILATDELYACVIADGLHVPDSFLKVLMKVKGEATLLVSDATRFAGMPPGEYESSIGGAVILDQEKRVSLKSTPGLLAGAAKNLLENVQTLIDHGLASHSLAWRMGSVNVADMLAAHGIDIPVNEDFVLFRKEDGRIKIQTVIKNKRIVFRD